MKMLLGGGNSIVRSINQFFKTTMAEQPTSGFRLMRMNVFQLSVVLAGLFILLSVWQSLNVSRLRAAESDATLYAFQLDAELGYGGLIHNFKNAVLRTQEPNYIESAQDNARQALILIEKLEAIAVSYLEAPRLPATRDMIFKYTENLNIVEQMIDAGATPAEIDPLVRINDAPAISELNSFKEALSRRIQQNIQRVQGVALVGAMFVVTGVVLLVGAFYHARLKQQEQLTAAKLDIQASANQQLQSVNDKLERSNTALNQFASVASHDLKSPARQMSMLAEIILSDPADKFSVEECAQSIKSSSEQMVVLVDGLLRFTRSAFTTPDIKTYDMEELVRRVVDDIESQGHEKPPEISVSNLPSIPSDPDLLERVWRNLIENSIKYVSKTDIPMINIEGWEQDNIVHYAISDNGIGIDPKFEKAIFEPLHRLHGANSDYKGQGIGLWLTANIVSAHGGEIALDTSYDQGARFVFKLPK